jgi:hypothetical protein
MTGALRQAQYLDLREKAKVDAGAAELERHRLALV